MKRINHDISHVMRKSFFLIFNYFRLNPLVPKHIMHYQKTFRFHPGTSFGKSNRKQGLNLCLGQRLPRLTCSIYATLGIMFS